MTVTYAVRARNTATESENRIHSDDVAQRFGFRGGLVPGVTVYAYMVRPVAERWGRDWVERGMLTARFAQPLYEGDDATVEFDEESGEVIARNSGGEACGIGRAGWRTVEPPGADDYPPAPVPPNRPVASPESLAPGTVLGSIDAGFHAARAGEFLDLVDDRLPLWTDGAVAHPGYLVTFANYILSSNVKLGPWIHVETTANHFSAVEDGDRWSMRGRVADAYERKGHKIVELDLLVLANLERPVVAYRHTAIYEPRQTRG